MAGNWNRLTRLAIASGLVLTALATTDTAVAAGPLTGAWTVQSAMPSLRTGARAFSVPGAVFVVGDSSSPVRARSALLYDIATDSWASAGSPAGEHDADLAAAQLADGRIVVVGGGSGPGTTAADIWDPATQAWSPLPPMAAKRDDAGMVGLADGRLLVVGGNTSAPLTAEIYDPATNLWSPTGAPPFSPLRLVGQLPSGKVFGLQFFATGATHQTALWDVATGTWTPAAPFPIGGGPPTVAIAGGTAIAIGGGTFPATRTTHRFAEATNTWVRLGDLAERRTELSVAVTLANGDVLVLGGNGYHPYASDGTRSAEILDLATGTWSGTGRLNFNHGTPALVATADHVFVAGGWSGDAGTSFERFDPTAAPPAPEPSAFAFASSMTKPDAEVTVYAYALDKASYLPTAGATVRMEVLPGGPSTPGTVLACVESCATDVSGLAAATIVNNAAAGTDTVRVHVDLDNDGLVSAGEATTTVSIGWSSRTSQLQVFGVFEVTKEPVGVGAGLNWIYDYECTGGGYGGSTCRPLVAPIVGRTIHFYPRTGSSVELCSGVTGADGVARCGIPVDKVRAINGKGVRAVFDGDAMYVGSVGAKDTGF